MYICTGHQGCDKSCLPVAALRLMAYVSCQSREALDANVRCRFPVCTIHKCFQFAQLSQILWHTHILRILQSKNKTPNHCDICSFHKSGSYFSEFPSPSKTCSFNSDLRSGRGDLLKITAGSVCAGTIYWTEFYRIPWMSMTPALDDVNDIDDSCSVLNALIQGVNQNDLISLSLAGLWLG